LADRKDPSGISGHIMFDGNLRSSSYKYAVGYVVQDDMFSETLTVRENLLFSANLRLPKTLNSVEKSERVSSIISELGLQSCADTRMGTSLLRGVSGGEKKRTSIGMELILSPKILFLDEPTTGKT
jgi:ATP-binding cassette, subfamily G (WHITE), member 2